MALVIVRHGETALNAARVVQPKDTPLNERGIRQAASLAARLAKTRVARIVCSDLRRTRMTCEPIAEAVGLTPLFTPLLRERDFGVFLGTPYSELTVDLFGPDFAPEGGETWGMFDARVRQAFAYILEQARGLDGDLVVITHGWVCQRLVTMYGAAPEGTEFPSHWFNTGISILAAEPPHAVERINCAEHLGGDVEPTGMSGL